MCAILTYCSFRRRTAMSSRHSGPSAWAPSAVCSLVSFLCSPCSVCSTEGGFLQNTRHPAFFASWLWSIWPVSITRGSWEWAVWETGRGQSLPPFLPCSGQYFWQWLWPLQGPSFPQAAPRWWPLFLPSHLLSLSLQPWSCWLLLPVVTLWLYHLLLALLASLTPLWPALCVKSFVFNCILWVLFSWLDSDPFIACYNKNKHTHKNQHSKN